MYESSMTAGALIALAKDACDISPEIDDEYYLLWLSSFESTLYTGIVKSAAVADVPLEGGAFDPAAVQGRGETVRACDVTRVFICGRELPRTDSALALACPDKPCFYPDGTLVRTRAPFAGADSASIAYTERPRRKTAENYMSERVALPDEFLPMALDYLCGCAYALACEDTRASNCFERYNAALADFAAWIKGGGNENIQ